MEFMGPPMHWYNPPEGHEICACDNCHEAGEHRKDRKYWAFMEGCLGCVDIVDNPVDNEEELTA